MPTGRCRWLQTRRWKARGRRHCRRDRGSIGCWRRGSRTRGANAEWAEFVGRFERRKVAIGDCGRSYDTPCIHEHSCLGCPPLHPDPGTHARLEEIRGNLIARIAEAESHYWHGDVEDLNTSLAGANAKLAQMDQISASRTKAVQLDIPSFTDTAGRTVNPPTHLNQF